MNIPDKDLVRISSQNIAGFWDLHKRKLLNMEPPYQRRSVWTQDFRDYFIDTVLLNFPCPPVFLHEDPSPDGRFLVNVVDGKQRLGSVFHFINGGFPVGGQATLKELRGLHFSQLSPNIRSRFFQYTFHVHYLQTDDDELIGNMFDRMNRNVARLSPQELRHARFRGRFITTVEELTDWMAKKLPGMPIIVRRSQAQMKDLEFVATVLLMIEEGPRERSVFELDQSFAERDEAWPKEAAISERFRQAVEWFRLVLRRGSGKELKNSRLRNQADLYALLGAIDHLSQTSKLPSPADATPRLQAFVQAIEDEKKRDATPALAAYYHATIAGSGHTASRRKRIEILSDVIAGRLPTMP